MVLRTGPIEFRRASGSVETRDAYVSEDPHTISIQSFPTLARLIKKGSIYPMCDQCPSPTSPNFIHELINVLEEVLREGPPPGFKETPFSMESTIEAFQAMADTCNNTVRNLRSDLYNKAEKLNLAAKTFYKIAQGAEHNRETAAQMYKKIRSSDN